MRRRAFELVALATVFFGGWTSHRLKGDHERARAEATPASPTPATEAAGTCLDRNAMEANANLVGQLHEYRSRLDLANQRTNAAEREVASVAHGPPRSLVTSREEWARMARDGTIHVRVPCARWDGASRFSIRRAMQGSWTSRPTRNDVPARARAAGFSAEELEALAETYERVHQKAWALLRSTCEANASFRADVDEHASDGDLTDVQRLALCRSSVLDVSDVAARVALTRVAELHAAGGGFERASGDAQRVAFALTNTPAALFDEMTRVLGREKATRAIEQGVVCLDETAFDVRESAPDG